MIQIPMPSLSISLIAGMTVVLAGASPAQSVTADVLHPTNFSVVAGPNAAYATPAGTVDTAPLLVSLTDTVLAVPPDTGATRTYALHSSWTSTQPDLVRFDLLEQNTVGPKLGFTSGPPASAANGPHDLILRVHSPARRLETFVRLRATLDLLPSPGTATDALGDIKIDVGNDGSWELDMAGSPGTRVVELPFVAPPGTLEIRVSTTTATSFYGGAHSFLDSTARATVGIDVEARAVSSIGAFNSACQGSLFTRLRPNLVGQLPIYTDVFLTNLPQVLLLGGSQLNLVLPGGCLLGTSIDAIVQFAPTSSATPAYVIELPANLPSNIRMWAQAASLGPTGNLVSGPLNEVLLR